MMKTWRLVLAAIACGLGCGVAHAADAGAIQVVDVRSLRNALAEARRVPHTVIEMAPGEYAISQTLVVQGDGTVLHGNGATLVSTVVYQGRIEKLTGRDEQGTAIAITPLLGREVPFEKSQTGGLWRNRAGGCGALNKAAGGTEQAFYEHAPCQDADGKPTATYELFAPYLVPARNITVDNLNIRFGSEHCDSTMYVMYATNVRVAGIKVLNRPLDLGKGASSGDLWSNGSGNVTFEGCSGAVYIEMNSSNNCLVSNCKVGGVTFEEMCRLCLVKGCVFGTCRTNDLLCSDIVFDGNTFTGTGENTVSLWGGTRIRFVNNVSAGAAWLGGTDTRGCEMSGNTGPAFLNYGAAGAGNVLGVNTVRK